MADDYVDLGFMMDSGMSRMLAEDPIYLTELALIASKPAVPCGRPGSPYSSCQTETKNPIIVPPLVLLMTDLIPAKHYTDGTGIAPEQAL
jgi:hypothetical protein